MSTTDKPDPVRGALFFAKLLAEGESKRIEGLSDADFVAEMKRKGLDPSRETDVEALLEKVKIRAVQQGRAVAPEPAVMPEVLPAPVRRAVPLRRPPRIVWSVAAMFVVAIAVVAVLKRPDPVATPQTPRETAERLRTEAIDHCARALWARCRQELDDAARLDPAGDSEPRVQKARGEIDKSQYPGPISPEGPGP